MSGPQRTLSHMAFFEAIARTSESSPEWPELRAGLVTMRLVDDWFAREDFTPASLSATATAVRNVIAKVERRTIRVLLESLVDGMQDSPEARPAKLAPRLIAYARAIQFDGQWSLAADVYRTVLSAINATEDSDIVVTANMHLGRCLRVEADWVGAMSAYRTAADVAAISGDFANVLRSHVGQANVARDRGNLPYAEMLLEETIRDAEFRGLRDIRTLALQERAVVAHRRGEYERAVEFGYEAYTEADQILRDYILADLAGFFFDLGIRSAARDAHLILAATAMEQYVRWQATINLIEIAAIEGSEPTFEHYRRQLAAAALPASLAPYYHIYVAKGHKMFGRPEQARSSLERAIELAEAHQINQALILAEQELRELNDQGVVIISQTRAATPSRTTAPIVEAIHQRAVGLTV